MWLHHNAELHELAVCRPAQVRLPLIGLPLPPLNPKFALSFKGSLGALPLKPVCPDMRFYTQWTGRFPVAKTWPPAVPGRVVAVLKFRSFACFLFQFFMAAFVFCSVLICTAINLQELLRKQNPIPFFKLQDKIKGKGRMRKALQSPPLRRIQS